jgi:hypothetical protein
MRQPPHRRNGADPLALDDATVDRLLTGTLRAADAPPGYAKVAELLAATVAPPTPRELASQAAVLAELRAVTRARLAAATPPPRPRRRRRMFGLAAVVVAGALATGGAAAAATGHLPEPVRQAARSILTVPSGRPAATPTPPEPSPATRTPGTGGSALGASPSTVAPGRGPGATAAGPAAGPDLDGLCKAYLAGKGGEQGGKLDATAFRALSAAAGGDDQVTAFCQDRQAADAKSKKPKDSKPRDPPGGAGQDGPLAATGGGGQGQSGPPATSPPPADPHG